MESIQDKACWELFKSLKCGLKRGCFSFSFLDHKVGNFVSACALGMVCYVTEGPKRNVSNPSLMGVSNI